MATERDRKWVAGRIAGVWLGLLLILATIGKVAEPVVFVQQIRNEGLDFLLSGNQVALIALALEAGLGTALLLGVRSYTVLLPTSALVAFFVFLTARNYFFVLRGIRDPDYDCGCFGFLWDRTAVEAFWQDLFLMVPALTILLWSRQRTSVRPAPRLLGIGAGAAAVALLYSVLIAGMPPDLPRAPAGADREFAVSDTFLLRIDGQVPEAATLYQSEDSLRFIIIAPQFEWPILLDVIRFEVVRLAEGNVERFSDGTAHVTDIMAGDVLGQFSLGPAGLSFSLGGHQIELGETPAN